MAEYQLPRSPVRRCPCCVFVNQAGYLPHAKKVAVIAAPCSMFSVLDETGAVCFSGRTAYFGFDRCSGDTVFTADFSALTADGRYTISTDTGETSLPFAIGAGVYDRLLHDLCKAYYYLRCGCALEPEHAGVYTHAACHTAPARLWEDPSVTLDVTGGWHDAGDYGRYVTPAATALAHLLMAWKLFPRPLAALRLNLPERGNGLPDLPAACRYALAWLLKLQRGDGGVYHKVTSAHHAPFVMPEADTAPLFVFAVSSPATADFAAVCALASDIYRCYDPAFADTLLHAAKRAYGWLNDHPAFVGFENPVGNHTGVYGEDDDADNRFWASAALYAATGDVAYHAAALRQSDGGFSLTELGCSCVGGLGAMSYLFCDRPDRDTGLLDRCKTAFLLEAEALEARAFKCGYGIAMEADDYCWGSTMCLMKQGMIFATADRLAGGQRFRNAAAAQLHSLLGVNALGFSYVSGTGAFAINFPHLRPAHADGISACIPGMVSGGPNRTPCANDQEIVGFAPDTPPMKCFVDDVSCYSLNEITIYWNSPTVFTLASLLAAEDPPPDAQS